MPPRSRFLSWVLLPWIAAALVIALSFVVPAALRGWLAKEGPLEWFSHLVLVAGIVLFVAGASRHRSIAVGALAAFVVLVLAEELDWGAQLGVSFIADALVSMAGDRNLHNRLSGHSYLLFVAPVVAYHALALPRADSLAKRILGVAAPTRNEGLAFLSLLLVVVLLAIVMPSWERERDELIETILYVLWLAIGIRIIRAPRAGGSEK